MARIFETLAENPALDGEGSVQGDGLWWSDSPCFMHKRQLETRRVFSGFRKRKIDVGLVIYLAYDCFATGD